MLSNELEGPAVSSGRCKYVLRSLLIESPCRYAALLYSKDGHNMVDRLWRETLDEVGAFDVEKTLLYE